METEFLSVQLDVIQLLVLILGVTEVLLARANNIWLYPTGIAAILLSLYHLFEAHLYGECFLHLYYLVMSIYGWLYWSRKKGTPGLPVTRASSTDWRMTISIVVFGWFILFIVLDRFTPSEVPLWDSWVSATGWAGMWLLARRKVENWILLNISNAFAIPLLITKDLHLLALLTAVLFLVACKGYIDWLKLARSSDPPAIKPVSL